MPAPLSLKGTLELLANATQRGGSVSALGHQEQDELQDPGETRFSNLEANTPPPTCPLPMGAQCPVRELIQRHLNPPPLPWGLLSHGHCPAGGEGA